MKGSRIVKYTINLDKNNYILSIANTTNDSQELDITTIDTNYLNCYKYSNGIATLDENKKKQVDEEKQKQENAEKIVELKLMLSSQDSEYGDWKNLKQIDTGEYTEEQMKEYRKKRQEIREEIRKLEEELGIEG